MRTELDHFKTKFKQDNLENILLTVFFKEVENVNDTYEGYELQSQLDRMILEYKAKHEKIKETRHETPFIDDIQGSLLLSDRESKMSERVPTLNKVKPIITQVNLRSLNSSISMGNNFERSNYYSQGR